MDDFMLDLEDLEILEYLERRSKYIPEYRNQDLDELDDVDFKKRYRFNKDTVEEVLAILKPQLDSTTGWNRALSAEEKLLAALKFFAFGNQQINIGDLHQISQPSSSRAINNVARLLAELSPQYIYLPQTEAEIAEISGKFYQNFDFPNVYGALDCTLIKLLSPGGINAERFRCRKGFFALNVQTLSDTDLFIRNLVVRWPGSAHDSTVFDNSSLRAHLELNVPEKYHVLDDSGYPLRSYLLTPFLNPANASQERYNAAQIKARNVVERHYGLWKKRFSSIATPLRCSLDNAQTIVVATAVLHNIALQCGDDCDEEDHVEDDDEEINSTTTANGITKRNSVVTSYFTY